MARIDKYLIYTYDRTKKIGGKCTIPSCHKPNIKGNQASHFYRHFESRKDDAHQSVWREINGNQFDDNNDNDKSDDDNIDELQIDGESKMNEINSNMNQKSNFSLKRIYFLSR